MDIDLPGAVSSDPAEPAPQAGPYMSRELKSLLAEMRAEGRDIPRGQLEPDMMPESVSGSVPESAPDQLPALVPETALPMVVAPASQEFSAAAAPAVSAASAVPGKEGFAVPVQDAATIASISKKASRKEMLRNVGKFLLWFVFVFGVTFTALYLVGAVPDVLKSASDTPTDAIFKAGSLPDGTLDGQQTPAEQAAAAAAGEEPERIIIASIGVNAPVLNPDTTDTDTLDSDLQHGAVHYPGSGLLGGQGNVFLFGHSTGFKIVNNQAYKTFNNIKTLKKGDKISVFSKTKEYVFSVDTVTLVDADKALVDLSTTGQKLTLSTCNTFGEKQERHVVEATFVSTSPLPPSKS